MPMILWVITLMLVRFRPLARSAMPGCFRQRKGSKSARRSAAGHARG